MSRGVSYKITYKPYNQGKQWLLPPSLDELVPQNGDQNIFLFSRYDLNELVDLQYKQIGVYWWLVDGYVRDTGGSAYIKQSNQKGYSYGVRPAIIVSRQGLVWSPISW